VAGIQKEAHVQMDKRTVLQLTSRYIAVRYISSHG